LLYWNSQGSRIAVGNLLTTLLDIAAPSQSLGKRMLADDTLWIFGGHEGKLGGRTKMVINQNVFSQ
jgi:hypothetical protein